MLSSTIKLFIGSCFAAILLVSTHSSFAQRGNRYTVTILDSLRNDPLELAHILLSQEGRLLKGKVSDSKGTALFTDIPNGSYEIEARYIGYATIHRSITLISTNRFDTLRLVPLTSDEVLVTAPLPSISSIDVKSAHQIFEQESFHQSPQEGIVQLLTRNVIGAVRAPTGEVHIQGEHGEFSYHIDGIPIPQGVFGGLNEVIDPNVISRGEFITGGFPAEYGGQMAAIIKLQTRVPNGAPKLNISSFIGQRLSGEYPAGKFALQNGQSISGSASLGDVGFFLSGNRAETDRRIDPPTDSIFHDHGFDYSTFGKIDWDAGEKDHITSNLSFSRTRTEIPYDPAKGFSNDLQTTINSFQTLSYTHDFASDETNELFLGLFARQGSLLFEPSLSNVSKVELNGAQYVLREDRAFTNYGIRTSYTRELSHALTYKVGGIYDYTFGSGKFDLRNISASHPLSFPYEGYNAGGFAQTEWHPLEWTRFDVGVRFDAHKVSNMPTETALEPRLRWNIFPDPFNAVYLYYGRTFIPTLPESVRGISSLLGDTTNSALAERAQHFEVSWSRSWPFGLSSKLNLLYKLSQPGLDDKTLGSSAIKTPVNIEKVKTTGIEVGLFYVPINSPLSINATAALLHAVGEETGENGTVSYFDLDHDQRLSMGITANYQTQRWFSKFAATYASGLTNGNENYSFERGPFAFNQGAHVTPAWILDIGGGYTIPFAGTTSIELSAFIDNLLDHNHLLKGSFFSAASYEKPRTVTAKLALHF